jgi:phosphatidylserine/phosphatidylglycerophosphate/cardiolipin synthase-like enzyme
MNCELKISIQIKKKIKFFTKNFLKQIDFKKVRIFILALTILSLPFVIEYFKSSQQIILEPSLVKQILFILPDEKEGPLLKEIEKAQKSINLEMYLLSNKKIIQALKDAKKRGVEIKIILEKNPYNLEWFNKKIFKEFKESGIQIKWGNPEFSLTHSKFMIIDDQVVIIMTCNFTYSGFNKSRDFGLINFDSKDVKEIKKLFEADWQNKSFTSSRQNLVISPTNSRSKLENIIKNAKSEILVMAEIMGDQEIQKFLSKAQERGVRIKILLADIKDSEINRETEQYFQTHNIQIKYLKKPFLHAKIIIVDNKILYLGSINFSSPSLDENRELGILLVNKNLIQQVRKVFEKDWGED